MSGGKPGFVIHSRPRRYKTTEQQKLVRNVAERCNIRKGMSRAELVDKMVHCVPEQFKEIKGSGETVPAP